MTILPLPELRQPMQRPSGMARLRNAAVDFLRHMRRRWYLYLPIFIIWALAYLRLFFDATPRVPVLFNVTPSLPYKVALLHPGQRALRRGERLMGFGHRIYRVRDPRADVLKGAVSRLRGAGNRIGFAESVEREALARLAAAKPLRPLDTNVEFYTALLLEALDLPRDLFTCIFAMGRMAGWTAHVLEQERSGRLIRPQSRYVGPMPAASVRGAA